MDKRENKNIVIQYDSLDRYRNRSKYALQSELKTQIENYYNEHIGSIAQYINKKVFFVIYEYNLHNDYGSYTFKIKGDLFLIEKENYYLLSNLDTLIYGDESNINVFFNNHSGSIYYLLQNSALLLPDYLKPFDKNCASNLDSFVKSNTNLYGYENLISGIYYNYSSLMRQHPNYKFEEAIDIQATSEINNILKKLDVEYDSIYAIVVNNSIFIPIRKKWYRMEKIESDFYCDLKLENIHVKRGQSQNLGKDLFDLKNEYYKNFSYANPALYNLMLYGFSAPWFRFKLNCRTGHLSFIQGIEKPRSASKAR